MSLIVYPDVELELTGYLRTGLAAHGYTIWDKDAPNDDHVFVSNQRLAQKTAVWVRRDGGPQLDAVREAARVGINVFAPTILKANDLARVVSALVRGAADGDPIIRARQTSGLLPVADNTGPRVYQTHEVWVRGAALT